MQSEVLHLTGGHLRYHQFGTGSNLWIALHGFAQEGGVFTPLAYNLPENTCLIALDLPWHGGSTWKGTTFSIADIVEAIDQLLLKKQQTHYAAVGFSFGARLCMAMATMETRRWDRLILLAPDGLPVKGWYHLMDSMPLIFKKQVVKFLKQVPFLLKMAKRLHEWKILDGFSYRFLRLHLQSESSRKRMTGVWLSAASFPSLDHNCEILRHSSRFPIQLVTGDKDQIISQSAFAHLAKCIPDLKWVKIENADHDLLSAVAVPQWIGRIIP